MLLGESRRFVLSPFQKFCIRWSVFFDSLSDRLSPIERLLRTFQLSIIMLTTVLTMLSVLFADNKIAVESMTYFLICIFALAITAFAIRTKRFNRVMLLMVEEEFAGYDRPMPDSLKSKMSAIRTSYAGFTKNILLMYLALIIFEVPATALVPLTAAGLTNVKLGSQSTLMVSVWFPGDTTKVEYILL